MLAVAAPAFADSKVNVKLWDKNGDMNADAKMGMGMPANMSMAMMKIQVDKQVVPAGKVTFEVTNTSKAAVHEMIVVPVTDPKRRRCPIFRRRTVSMKMRPATWARSPNSIRASRVR
ncbi:hypothetical protein ACVOMV_15685 [Mesorhizobium atlanticum]